MMVQGLDRREGVQDPNAQAQPMQAGSVPLSPIMSPRPAATSRIGQNEKRLAEALGNLPGLLTQYIDKKKPEWEVEGQMAYAAGVTEEEIRKKGNRYTTSGYMTMKAGALGNELFQQKMLEIEDTDKQMDSGFYQKKLKDDFKDYFAKMGEVDPDTKKMMATVASEMMPRLVSQQIVSNNKWREEETERSYMDLLNSQTMKASQPTATTQDVDDLFEILKPGVSGLPRDKEQKAQVAALKNAIDSDAGIIAERLKSSGSVELPVGLKPDAEGNLSVTFSPKVLKDFIAKPESGAAGYDAVVHGDSEIRPTEMTLGELKAWGQLRRSEKKDTAVGRYQIVYQTLLETQAALGLPDSTRFDANTQEMFADKLIEKRGLSKFLKGEISQEEFAANLAKEWAALPKDASNESHYQGVNGNRALVRFDDLVGVLGPAKQETSLVAAMQDLGFDPESVNALRGSLNSYQDRQTRKFSEERFDTEAQIAQNARDTGDIPGTLNLIKQAMAEKGYSEEWGNQQYSNAVAQASKWQEEQDKFKVYEDALDNSEVGLLPEAEQQKAYDYAQKQVEATLTNMEPAERETAVREHMIGLSITNGVVNNHIQNWVRLGLSGDVVDKEGNANPKAMEAYKALVNIRKQDTDLADAYAGDNKELFYEAMENDSRMDGDPMALARASQTLQRVDEGWTPPAVNPVDVEKAIDKKVDDLRVGFWERVLPAKWTNTNNASRTWWGWSRTEMTSDELKQARNNQQLKQRIEKETKSILKNHPGMSTEAAANQATTQIMNNSTIVAGNVIAAPPTGRRTVYEASGVSADKVKTNTFHVAITDILSQPVSKENIEKIRPLMSADWVAPKLEAGESKPLGELVWGDTWNKTQIMEKGWAGKLAGYTAGGAAIGTGLGFFTPVGTAAGAAVGAGAGGIAGVDMSNLGQSIFDLIRKYPEGMMVEYNYDAETWLVTVPLDKDRSEYSSVSLPIPAAMVGDRIRARERELMLPKGKK